METKVDHLTKDKHRLNYHRVVVSSMRSLEKNRLRLLSKNRGNRYRKSTEVSNMRATADTYVALALLGKQDSFMQEDPFVIVGFPEMLWLLYWFDNPRKRGLLAQMVVQALPQLKDALKACYKKKGSAGWRNEELYLKAGAAIEGKQDPALRMCTYQEFKDFFFFVMETAEASAINCCTKIAWECAPGLLKATPIVGTPPHYLELESMFSTLRGTEGSRPVIALTLTREGFLEVTKVLTSNYNVYRKINLDFEDFKECLAHSLTANQIRKNYKVNLLSLLEKTRKDMWV